MRGSSLEKHGSSRFQPLLSGKFYQFGEQAIHVHRAGSNPDENIVRDQSVLPQPEPFPDQPLCSISIHGTWQETLGNDEAETRLAFGMGPHLDRQRGASETSARCQDCLDIGTAKTLPVRVAIRAGDRGVRLRDGPGPWHDARG